MQSNGKHSFTPLFEVRGSDTSRARVFRCTFDKKGRLAGWTYLSAGKPADFESKDMHKPPQMRIVYDGDMEWHRYFDEKSRPTRLGSTGEFAEAVKRDVAHKKDIVFEYDSLDNLLSEDYNGANRYEAILDDDSNEVSSFALNPRGDRIAQYSGLYEYRCSYNSSGDLISYASFDKNGNLIEVNDAAAKQIMKWNAQHEMVESQHYGMDDRPTYVTRYTYDKNGYLTTQTGSDDHGRSAEDSLVWDEEGNAVFHGQIFNGVLAKYTRSFYDRQNNHLGDELVDSTGSIVFKTTNTFENGILTREDIDQKSEAFGNIDYHSVLHQYDSHGDLAELWYVDADGKLPTSGACILHYKRGRLGEILETSWLDSKRYPATGSDGYAKKVFSYDDGGYLSAVKKFDASGKEIDD